MISFGSREDVVFILHVNLRERGLAWSSFTAPLNRGIEQSSYYQINVCGNFISLRSDQKNSQKSTFEIPIIDK